MRRTTHFFAIIVAGGSGSRMKSDIAKQFLLLRGKPILQHTIEQFLAYSPDMPIRLVLPERDLAIWESLCATHQFFPANVTTIIGGATRFQSVRNGLASIPADADETGLVTVHDGVRPYVTPATIAVSFATASHKGSAVTCVPAKDSVRLISSDGSSKAIDRAQVRLIQTPQTFRLDWFRQAFAGPEQAHFTDCASVLEFAGYPISLIEGDYENIKITTPDDLKN
ncbi:2-C-methyl-D-erythritol 4-phosphate cytidylyltransferase [Fibrella forsythiae]|uniref:2-C-methyl-D-erythritol 4-phosphate cytidylyltransferase n=1 Tax=Fibrella forsythiae TaxID=2817061 RepID=A0ABS3JJR9_9BACT|nr:2-C-methyl-D-erythritol 4-phosphate cytidylyltransferase [Fibrella forsythiae]MBO0949693.1 2-C-methyl-D-erythritol 4-phosphate cytidylyltransferase [Fibrella forsythiae]